MAETFELYLLPILRKDGREQNQITGLFAATAPRKSQRSHQQDRLFLWMTMVVGHSLLPEEAMQKVTKDAATLYYNTKGTVTSGLNAAANHINDALRVIAGGEPLGAKLNMAVLRGDMLYMAHAGAVFTFLMRGDEVKPFFSPLSEKQLPGYMPEIQPQYFTTRIQMGDAFLFTPQPAQEWEREVLQFGDDLDLSVVRRRLLDQTRGDFSAILMQLKPGKKGTFHLLRPSLPPAIPAEQQPEERPQGSVEPAAAQPEPAQPKPLAAQAEETTPSIETGIPVVIPQQQMQAEEEETPPWEEELSTEPTTDYEPVYDSRTPPQVLTAEQAQPNETRQNEPERTPLIERLPIPDFRKWGIALAAFWVKLRKLDQESADEAAFDIDETDEEGQRQPAAKSKSSGLEQFKLPISNQILLAIAVIVPLLISVIAATVYSQRGVQQQYDTYMALANQAMNEALNEEEDILRQAKLDESLGYLNQAEEYKITSNSKVLHDKLNELMDDTGEVSRVEIFSALDQRLNKNINLTKLVTTSTNDLYALDSSTGQVLHFRYGTAMYELDTSFQCGGSGLRKVIDIAPLAPTNKLDAAIVTLSETGVLTYCTPGKEPQSITLQVPIYGWSAIADMDVERDLLFIVDSGTRAVWSYYGLQQDFTEAEPRLFFPHDPEVELAETVGIDVFSDTMVFLNSDNTIATCLVQSLDAEFRECLQLPPRDSKELTLVFKNLNWIDFFPADYPPAFYLMDGTSKTLYRFSYKMIINKAYRFMAMENESLPQGEITAFTVTDNQLVLVAYGNELYIGQLRVE
ncbi:MAG: hypothetical protein V2J07_10980 [Anaerolineae bacterium]|jgi:hypothetical protein|nr:hypothetical protein [Anaerolineae bacterium]